MKEYSKREKREAKELLEEYDKKQSNSTRWLLVAVLFTTTSIATQLLLFAPENYAIYLWFLHYVREMIIIPQVSMAFVTWVGYGQNRMWVFDRSYRLRNARKIMKEVSEFVK